MRQNRTGWSPRVLTFYVVCWNLRSRFPWLCGARKLDAVWNEHGLDEKLNLAARLARKLWYQETYPVQSESVESRNIWSWDQNVCRCSSTSIGRREAMLLSYSPQTTPGLCVISWPVSVPWCLCTPEDRNMSQVARSWLPVSSEQTEYARTVKYKQFFTITWRSG